MENDSMPVDIDFNDPAAVTAEYIRVKKHIEELEGRQLLLKTNLERLLEPDRMPPEQKAVWSYGDYVVTWVKGRKSEKFDKAKLKRELLLAGVEVGVVEGTFEKATTTTTGSPYLRVSEGGGQPEE